MRLMNNGFQAARSAASSRTWLLLAVALLVTGCSTSGLIIRYFYGQIDNSLYDRIVAYATFDEAQKSEIRRAVDNYARWHRHSELPRYANFLDDIGAELKAGTLSDQVALDYLEKAREFAKMGFGRSPFTESPQFLKTLSDWQVDEIEVYYFEQDKKFLKWYEKRQQQGGNSRRLKGIVKNIGRIGVKLNADQKKIIEQGLAQYKGDPMQRHKIFNQWQSEFIDLLRKRNQAGFVQAVSAHIAVYQDQIKLNDPRQHLYNQQTSAQIIAKVVESLNPNQKEKLSNRIRQTRNTLIKMSAG